MLSKDLFETQTEVKILEDELQQSERERRELENHILVCVEEIRHLKEDIEEMEEEHQRSVSIHLNIILIYTLFISFSYCDKRS